MNNIIRPEAWWGDKSPPPPLGPPEPPDMELTERVARIEVRMDTAFPTLATKADLLGLEGSLRSEMHKEFNLQTWRIVGAIVAVGGLLVAGLRLLP